MLFFRLVISAFNAYFVAGDHSTALVVSACKRNKVVATKMITAPRSSLTTIHGTSLTSIIHRTPKHSTPVEW